MKHCLLVSLLLMAVCTAFAQTEWTGVVRQKPWAKTTESYCAQGSDYYVLESNGETYVLAFANDALAQQIAKLKDRRVSFSGALETRTIAPEPGSQHPVSQQPVMQQPVEQQPIKPAKQTPAKGAPVAQQPVTQRPVEQRPQTAEAAFTCTVLRVQTVKPPKRG